MNTAELTEKLLSEYKSQLGETAKIYSHDHTLVEKLEYNPSTLSNWARQPPALPWKTYVDFKLRVQEIEQQGQLHYQPEERKILRDQLLQNMLTYLIGEIETFCEEKNLSLRKFAVYAGRSVGGIIGLANQYSMPSPRTTFCILAATTLDQNPDPVELVETFIGLKTFQGKVYKVKTKKESLRSEYSITELEFAQTLSKLDRLVDYFSQATVEERNELRKRCFSVEACARLLQARQLLRNEEDYQDWLSLNHLKK